MRHEVAKENLFVLTIPCFGSVVLGLKAEPSRDQQMHDKLQQFLDFRDEKRTRLASNFLDILIDNAEQKLKQKGGAV